MRRVTPPTDRAAVGGVPGRQGEHGVGTREYQVPTAGGEAAPSRAVVSVDLRSWTLGVGVPPF